MSEPREPAAESLGTDNRRMLGKLAVIVLLMFGFGYALVPMYRAICDALGINVLSVSEQRVSQGWLGGSKAGSNTQVDTTRTITVEFDANARGPKSELCVSILFRRGTRTRALGTHTPAGDVRGTWVPRCGAHGTPLQWPKSWKQTPPRRGGA